MPWFLMPSRFRWVTPGSNRLPGINKPGIKYECEVLLFGRRGFGQEKPQEEGSNAKHDDESNGRIDSHRVGEKSFPKLQVILQR